MPMTNEDHNRYIAYAFFAHAGFQVFGLLLMMLWMSFFFRSFPGPDPSDFFTFFMIFAVVFHLILTTPAVVAGWAMLNRKPWARIAGIVGAVTSVMSVPIGTATAAYAFWFWMGGNWKDVYPPDDDDFGSNSPRGLNSADDFDPVDNTPMSEEWMKNPPDWR